MAALDFITAVDSLVKEKGIDANVVFSAIELALAAAYKKNFNSLKNVRVDINRATGDIRVTAYRTVVEDYNEEEEDEAQILLEEALEIDSTIKIGDIIEEEVTPKDFGRVATATAKQVVIQKIREAERESILEEFSDKQDELVIGLLSREDVSNYYVDLGRSHGILPKTEIIPGEKLQMGSQIKAYVTKIESSTKGGPLILLSRSHYGFVKRLFELEIPEINDGSIMIYSVAREAGSRSKVAVYSENSRIDAVGSCIGERGSRINRIMKELSGEKIDLIQYDKDPATFIKNALSPAKDVSVFIFNENETQALAVADGESLSLAIGRRGQNVKLAARLTHYRIDVKTTEQLSQEGINIRKSE